MKRYKAHGFLLSQGIISVLIIVLMTTVVVIGGHTYINAVQQRRIRRLWGDIGQYRMEVLILPSLRI